MQVGTTLLLPCFIDGCGLFVGDAIFAQGDGEVSGTAIEMGAGDVRVESKGGAPNQLAAFRRGRAAQDDRARRFYATSVSAEGGRRADVRDLHRRRRSAR